MIKYIKVNELIATTERICCSTTSVNHEVINNLINK